MEMVVFTGCIVSLSNETVVIVILPHIFINLLHFKDVWELSYFSSISDSLIEQKTEVEIGK